MVRASTLILLAFATAALVMAAPVKKAKAASSNAADTTHKAVQLTSSSSHTTVNNRASTSAKIRRASPGSGRTVKYVRGKHGKLIRVVAKAPSYQLHPDPARYQEIQQALADKGYFKGQVNGEWGDDSQDALRRFQADRKLDDDGHLSALTLIGLGLGPKHDHDLAIPAAAPVTPATIQDKTGSTSPSVAASPNPTPPGGGTPDRL